MTVVGGPSSALDKTRFDPQSAPGQVKVGNHIHMLQHTCSSYVVCKSPLPPYDPPHPFSAFPLRQLPSPSRRRSMTPRKPIHFPWFPVFGSPGPFTDSVTRLVIPRAPASQVWHAEPIPKPNLTERGLPTWSTVDSSLCGKSVREEETNRRRLDGIGDTLLLWEKVLREIGLLFLHGLPNLATHPRIPTQ